MFFIYLILTSALTIPVWADVTDSLIAWWKLDDGSGTSAIDSSDSGYTGTLTNGPTWVAGKRNSAVSFDGSDDYISASNASPLRLTSGGFSVAAWTNVSATGQQMFLFHGTGCIEWASWMLSIGGTENGEVPNHYFFGFATSNTPASNTVASAGNADTGVWVHIAATYDGASLLSLYKNGVLDNTASVSGNPYNNTANLILGQDIGCGGRFKLAGLLDDARIYNRALTAAEVKSIYLAGTPQGSINNAMINNMGHN